MKILHVCNWVGGVTTRNVAALKQWSLHRHELVVKVDHCYDMATEPAHLTERNTTRDMVLSLIRESDALHFHAVGYDGASGLQGTIHDVDWSEFLGKKKFILHGMVSDLQPDGSWVKRHGARFNVAHLDHYDALMGPHLSCKFTYEDRLQYVPDIVPINDWLYAPLNSVKTNEALTFKDHHVVVACQAQGLQLEMMSTPTKLTHQLAARRGVCKATLDNSTDGHWGLFGIESLSQGVPSIAHTAKVNGECWRILKVTKPPFFECEYGGRDVPDLLRGIFNLPEEEWRWESRRARSWVEEFYNPGRLVKRWDDVYDSLEREWKLR